MQLTNAQKALALKELLEMLAEHPEGLPMHELRATKSFRYKKELTINQVEQLLSNARVTEMQLKMSALRYEKFYKLTEAGLRVVVAMREVQGKP